jgi:hypothetical protein
VGVKTTINNRESIGHNRRSWPMPILKMLN